MKPREGQIIEINGNIYDEGFEPVKARVMALLNVQFTAVYLDGTETSTFRFYADEGSTWRHV